MNKNSILKSGFILPLVVAGSSLKIMFTVRPKSNNNLNTNKLFKYDGEMYTGEEIRKLLNE